MNNFLLGLQFLTRITIKKNLDWSEKACGGSVKFFPFNWCNFRYNICSSGLCDILFIA